MKKVDILRAWKDTEYRQSLTAEQISALPANPAGELSEIEQTNIDGGTHTVAAVTQCGYNNPPCRVF